MGIDFLSFICTLQAPQQFELKKNEREEVKLWRPKHKEKV
jgi:hypothetical protein